MAWWFRTTDLIRTIGWGFFEEGNFYFLKIRTRKPQDPVISETSQNRQFSWKNRQRTGILERQFFFYLESENEASPQIFFININKYKYKYKYFFEKKKTSTCRVNGNIPRLITGMHHQGTRGCVTLWPCHVH